MRGMRKPVVKVGLALVAVLLLLAWRHGGARLTPEQEVQALVRQFIDNVERNHVADAGRLLAPQYHWDHIPKSDFVRGMLMVEREYDRLMVSLDDTPRVIFDDESCQAGTVVVRCAVSGWRKGAVTTVGADRAVEVRARVERIHGHYKFTEAHGGGRFENEL